MKLVAEKIMDVCVAAGIILVVLSVLVGSLVGKGDIKVNGGRK